MKTIQMVIQSDVKLSFYTRLRVVVYENDKRSDMDDYSAAEINALIHGMDDILHTDDDYFLDVEYNDGALYVTCSNKNDRTMRIPEVWVERLLGKRHTIRPVYYGSAPWKNGVEIECVAA
jgi:hypothetical protein